jgi:regulator of sirC expression with transglutaminase-like and TPR domain
MPKPDQLPHLVRLLDDESPLVQENVLRELSAFGPWLTHEISRMNIRLTTEERRTMAGKIADYNRQWLREHWNTWQRITDEKERLEAALSLLAEFQYGRGYPVQLSSLLDSIASDYASSATEENTLTLAEYLFKTLRLGGVQRDFYNPYNSNLIYVIEAKRGIPLSLACVFMLVGRRRELRIEGCNFPGHFLAIAYYYEKKFVVDCFNGGQFLDQEDLLHLNAGGKIPLAELTQLECDADTMIARTLRNLSVAYKKTENAANAMLVEELLESMEDAGIGGEE